MNNFTFETFAETNKKYLERHGDFMLLICYSMLLNNYKTTTDHTMNPIQILKAGKRKRSAAAIFNRDTTSIKITHSHGPNGLQALYFTKDSDFVAIRHIAVEDAQKFKPSTIEFINSYIDGVLEELGESTKTTPAEGLQSTNSNLARQSNPLQQSAQNNKRSRNSSYPNKHNSQQPTTPLHHSENLSSPPLIPLNDNNSTANPNLTSHCHSLLQPIAAQSDNNVSSFSSANNQNPSNYQQQTCSYGPNNTNNDLLNDILLYNNPTSTPSTMIYPQQQQPQIYTSGNGYYGNYPYSHSYGANNYPSINTPNNGGVSGSLSSNNKNSFYPDTNNPNATDADRYRCNTIANATYTDIANATDTYNVHFPN